MSETVLSQAEVESLLSVIESGVKGESAPAGGAAAMDAATPLAEGYRSRVTPYDFKRPERVGKEQMRAIQSLHEAFGRNFGAAISGLLRSSVEVKLTSAEQLSYSEFILSIENPTCLSLINAEPLDGKLILEINPSILYPIIDRLLGGGKESGPIARRALTEIELRLVSRITRVFLEEQRRAWANILPLNLEIDRVESNPQLVQIVPPNEVVILISFDLTVGDMRGIIHWCIPYNSMERISDKLAGNSWAAYGSADSTPETREQIQRRLAASIVEVVVTLAASKLRTCDLLGLRVGDIITTEKDVRSLLEIHVEGRPKFLARPGAYKGHKAVEVDGPLETAAAKDKR